MRVLVQRLQAVENLLRDHPIAPCLSLLVCGIGLLDQVRDLRDQQRRAHVVGERLQLDRGGERLGGLVLDHLRLQVLEGLGAVGGANLVTGLDVRISRGEALTDVLGVEGGGGLRNLLERLLDGGKVARASGVPHGVRPVVDIARSDGRCSRSSARQRRCHRGQRGNARKNNCAKHGGWAQETGEQG